MIEIAKLRPLGHRLLIKKVEEQSQTSSGLYIPEAAKEKGQRATVVAAGPGRLDQTGKVIPLAVKVGDEVIYSKFAGTQAGDDYLIITEDEVLGILEK